MIDPIRPVRLSYSIVSLPVHTLFVGNGLLRSQIRYASGCVQYSRGHFKTPEDDRRSISSQNAVWGQLRLGQLMGWSAAFTSGQQGYRS